jgi:Leucine-rich repeat (LRR) protein
MKIGELHLESNRLQVISFDNCSVEYLVVSQNHLKWLHIHNDLKGLVASENNIGSFVVSGEDSEIYHFDLSENENIGHVFPSLKNMQEMQFLNLSHSFIGVLESDAFIEMRELKYLFLKDCGIEIIPFELFVNNKFLMTLDISSNSLETIDLHMFTGLDRLRRLDISGNKLSRIDGFERIRTILPELKEIGISGNRFECHDLSVIVQTFEQIGLSVTTHQHHHNHHNHKFTKNVDGIPCY